jgi:glycosyltransferase involved in cell wall biosynthesis
MPSVLHVSFSSRGGAGEVGRRLAFFQAQLGWEADLFSLTDSNLARAPLALPVHTIAAGVDHFLLRSPAHCAPISLARDWIAASLPATPRPDVVHLHWINGVGTLRQFQRAFPSSALFFTLHDMNPLTGTCHYSLGCEKYETGCAACPAVRRFVRPLVPRNFRSKERAVQESSRLKLISPSEWLRECALKSPIFAGKEISVIRNPLSESLAPQSAPDHVRSGPVVFLLIAANLDDPVKGVKWALEALDESREGDWELRVVGKTNGLTSRHPRVTFVGSQYGDELNTQLAQADAIIIPSLQDNSPLVFGEAVSHGLFPMVRESAGLPELVKLVGRGATFTSPADLAQSLDRFVAMDPGERSRLRQDIAQTARKKLNPSAIAQQHLDLYKSALTL